MVLAFFHLRRAWEGVFCKLGTTKHRLKKRPSYFGFKGGLFSHPSNESKKGDERCMLPWSPSRAFVNDFHEKTGQMRPVFQKILFFAHGFQRHDDHVVESGLPFFGGGFLSGEDVVADR
jgi:hypothetical protein